MVGRSTYLTFAIVVASLLVGYSMGNFYPLIGSQTANSQPVGRQTTKAVASFNLPSFAPFRGSDSAKINFIEFGDYQCPFCDRFFLQTESSILQNYVNSSKVRFYFMDYAFLGPDSQTLSQGAWCADEQGLYYTYHDYIFSHQGQEGTGWATPVKLKTIVLNITGLSPQQFGSCLDSQKYAPRVQQLMQLGQSIGASATPTMFVGNNKIGYVVVVGAQPYSVFQQVMDSQLSKG